MIALGGGVTLAGVLNVLRSSGIPVYSLCPDSDFVRYSRWYRALPVRHANPRPADLEAILESLDLPEAVLLACSDDWLRAVANLPAELSTRFPSSTSGCSVDALVDKWRFAQLLERLDIPRPRTYLLSSRDQFDGLPEFDGAILKPLSSVDFAARHGVKGYLVANWKEALERLSTVDLPILIQEFIPGPPNAGYFLDGFRDGTGQISAMFARRRLRMYPEKLGNSTVTASVPLAEVEGAVLCLKYLLEEVRYRGIFSAEFKYDQRDGMLKVIEINARPWWYVEFAYRCGVDVCTMAYRDALGLPVAPVLNYEIGRRCIFPVNDLRAWMEEHRHGKASVWSLLETWIRSDGTPFHWNDPGPALNHMYGSLGSLLRSTFAGRRSENDNRGRNAVDIQHRSCARSTLPTKLHS
jgi:predicted ATP-grasp superfamily ATP-dependent carboligase